jgi:hypothetical protein
MYHAVVNIKQTMTARELLDLSEELRRVAHREANIYSEEKGISVANGFINATIELKQEKVFKEQPSLWNTMQDERDRRVIGKLLEELTELGTAASRCLIQGIDECEPSTGKPNKEWLEDEIADVRAMTLLTMQHFKLNGDRIRDRALVKFYHKRKWVAMPTLEELAKEQKTT